MMLRVQRERMSGGYFPTPREYTVGYGLTRARLALLRPGAAICHPGPMNRGLEISADAADAANSLILDQVAAGVAVRMSVLYELLGGADDDCPLTAGASDPAIDRVDRGADRRRRPGRAGAARDLLIRDGVFADPAEAGPDAERVDADGLVALPGLVDLHTHLREPGPGGRRDGRAPAPGRGPRRLHRGAGHGQHQPGHRHRRGGRARRRARPAGRGTAQVVPVGAVSKGLAGAELAELGLMARSRRGGPGVLRRRPLRRRRPADAPRAGVRPRLRRRASPSTPRTRSWPDRTPAATRARSPAGSGLPGWPAAAEATHRGPGRPAGRADPVPGARLPRLHRRDRRRAALGARRGAST